MIHLVDTIMGLVFIEALVLAIYHARTGRGLAPWRLGSNLAAGFFLLLTARCALAASPAWVLLACLLGALGAHLSDLAQRWPKS